MASTRDLRRRIKSVKNTSQITKAMQMVAASKMRRAQDAATGGRPYAELMNSVLAEVAPATGDFTHPLMEKREVKKRLVLVISSDKGLCGALNANLLREVGRADKETTVFVCAGRKGAQFVSRTKRDLNAEFEYSDAPSFAEARTISKHVQKLFLDGEVDQVDVAYTDFVNTLIQKPTIRTLLPVGEVSALEAGVEGDAEEKKGFTEGTLEFQFEPDASIVFGNLLPHYLNFQVFQMMLEAKASEHSARMVAMKNATDNAKKLIKDLSLEYNKLRQAAITTEILEISSAALTMG